MNIELTNKERESINNIDGKIVNDKHTFQLQVKKVLNPKYAFLQNIKTHYGLKYCGSVQMIRENGKDIWMLNGCDEEKYRILEPADGIDSYFEIEAKRTDI